MLLLLAQLALTLGEQPAYHRRRAVPADHARTRMNAMPSSASLATNDLLAHPGRAHLVGICGSGMQSLARLLASAGWRLTGSDVCRDVPAALRQARVPVACEHRAENVAAGVDLLVYSPAIGPGSPERVRASELRIPQLSYPEVLGRLMRSRRGLAVAGTHGKSTTTAMVGQILLSAGLNPTIVFGGVSLDRSLSGRLGSGEHLVVEACEYRESFLQLAPRFAAILNVEPDHFDCYPTAGSLVAAFEKFARQIEPGGLLLVPAACAVTGKIAQASGRYFETFGEQPAADWRAAGLKQSRGRYTFRLLHRNRELAEIKLAVAGQHQVHNALAAAALAAAAGAGIESIERGLGEFTGLARRFQVLGTRSSITVVDDYAHHPTELTATLAAARQVFPGRRLWCVFEPHQELRTRRLLDEFAASLQNADHVAIGEVFRARESAMVEQHATAVELAAKVAARGQHVLKIHALEAILEHIAAAAAAGDVVLTAGAGNIWKLADGLVERFDRFRAAG